MDFLNYVCGLSDNSVLSYFCGGPLLAAAIIVCAALFSLILLNILIKTVFGRVMAKRRGGLKEILKKPLGELEIANLALEIERERDLFRAVFSSMEEGFLVLDNDFKIILINSKASVLLRVAPKEAISRRVQEIFCFFKMGNEQNFLDEETKAFRRIAGEIDTLTVKMEDNYYCKNRKGVNFPISMTIAPLLKHGKGSVGAIIIFKDITEEKELDMAKSEFISLASHQLQTPLAAISWYTEMLLGKDFGLLNKKQREYMEEIYSSSHRMIELANALLNVSRVELGVLAIEPELMNLRSIALSVLKELQGQIELKKIRVIQEYDRNLSDVKADPRIMRVVFQNLFSNAVRYSFEEGEVRIKIEEQRSEILIEVKDGGYGIPKEQQSRIFTKLFRAHNVMQRIPEGSGLGLYVVKRLLEQAGGKIWFSSEGTDKGAVFCVSLPKDGMKKKSGIKILKELV